MSGQPDRKTDYGARYYHDSNNAKRFLVKQEEERELADSFQELSSLIPPHRIARFNHLQPRLAGQPGENVALVDEEQDQSSDPNVPTNYTVGPHFMSPLVAALGEAIMSSGKVTVVYHDNEDTSNL